MILTKRIGNLLKQPDIDVIVHQANLEHTFGAGIARQIREQLPYAFRADLATRFNDPSKLGSYSIGLPDETLDESGPVVINLYSQTSLYPSHTSYDAMYSGLARLRAGLMAFAPFPVNRIGFPYQLGSGLADGNWTVVEAIIKAVFEDSPFEIVIVKFLQPKSDPLTDMLVDVAIDAMRTL